MIEVHGEGTVAPGIERHIAVQAGAEIVVDAGKECPEPDWMHDFAGFELGENHAVCFDDPLLERESIHASRTVEAGGDVADARRMLRHPTRNVLRGAGERITDKSLPACDAPVWNAMRKRGHSSSATKARQSASVGDSCGCRFPLPCRCVWCFAPMASTSRLLFSRSSSSVSIAKSSVACGPSGRARRIEGARSPRQSGDPSLARQPYRADIASAPAEARGSRRGAPGR